jgi:hypothetical protein
VLNLRLLLFSFFVLVLILIITFQVCKSILKNPPSCLDLKIIPYCGQAGISDHLLPIFIDNFIIPAINRMRWSSRSDEGLSKPAVLPNTAHTLTEVVIRSNISSILRNNLIFGLTLTKHQD